MRTNLVPNPKLQNNSNFWSLDADFIRVATGGALSGGYIAQTSVSGFANFTTVNDINGYPVAPNTDYVFSFYTHVSVVSGNSPIAYINGDSAFGPTLGFVGVFDTGGGWLRVDIAFNSESHSLVYFRLSNNNGNVNAKYSNFQLELGTVSGAYFDGDSILSGYTYAWTGTANASSSTETATFTTFTKTFTVDGIVKVSGNSNTFTVDGIITSDEDESGDYIIRALMDTLPTGSLIGDATFVTGYTLLTPAVNSNSGQLEYIETMPNAFIFEADFYALGSADANYIYWGHSTTPGDENVGNGYTVVYNEYTGDGNEIQLRFNGVELTAVTFPHNLGDGEIRTLKVVFDNTRIYVYVNNVLCIDYDDIARSLPGTKVGIGARTGGLNAVHRCYRFIAYEFNAPWHPTIDYAGLSELEYRIVDLMKWNKDLVNNQPSVAEIRAVVRAFKSAIPNLTHLAISIPLDLDSDYAEVGIVPGPYMTITSFYQVWCDTIHEENLGVLFRGNFNGLEKSQITANWNFIMEVGINRTDPGNSTSEGQLTLIGKVHDLIVNNSSWFRDGDLFGVMPERTENNTSQVDVLSIVRESSMATVSTDGNHNVGDGQPVGIYGATPAGYNGSKMINKLTDTTFSYEVDQSLASSAGGTKTMKFGPSVFNDEQAWISATGAGVNSNFAQFFIDLKAACALAFAEIGKSVQTDWTSNNYSEVDSSWIPQALFDNAQKVVMDHYGITHTPFEMYSNLIGVINSKGWPVALQEWADHWNEALTDIERRDYLINFYNMLCQLYREGDYLMLNYWGGWVGTVEAILESTGTLSNPSYSLNQFGLILADYFNLITVETPTGVHDTAFGYSLNGVNLKRPNGFDREYIYQKTDYMTITGKTVRDTGGKKEKYILEYINLTKAQVDAIMDIIALNIPVQFIANGKDIININKLCFPYVGSINYDTPGSDYRASLTLELIEEE